MTFEQYIRQHLADRDHLFTRSPTVRNCLACLLSEPEHSELLGSIYLRSHDHLFEWTELAGRFVLSTPHTEPATLGPPFCVYQQPLRAFLTYLSGLSLRMSSLWIAHRRTEPATLGPLVCISLRALITYVSGLSLHFMCIGLFIPVGFQRVLLWAIITYTEYSELTCALA